MILWIYSTFLKLHFWHQISIKKLFHNGCWIFIVTLTSRKGTNKDRRQSLFLAFIKMGSTKRTFVQLISGYLALWYRDLPPTPAMVRAWVRGPARTCLCFGMHHQRMARTLFKSLHTLIIEQSHLWRPSSFFNSLCGWYE